MISSNIEFRERMLRLAVLGYMWDLAYLVALPVGAWLFDNGCYNCVFGTSVVLYVLACFLGWASSDFGDSLSPFSTILTRMIT